MDPHCWTDASFAAIHAAVIGVNRTIGINAAGILTGLAGGSQPPPAGAKRFISEGTLLYGVLCGAAHSVRIVRQIVFHFINTQQENVIIGVHTGIGGKIRIFVGSYSGFQNPFPFLGGESLFVERIVQPFS